MDIKYKIISQFKNYLLNIFKYLKFDLNLKFHLPEKQYLINF